MNNNLDGLRKNMYMQIVRKFGDEFIYVGIFVKCAEDDTISLRDLFHLFRRIMEIENNN